MERLKVSTTEEMFKMALNHGEPAKTFNGELIVYSETSVRVAIVKALHWYEEELLKKLAEEAEESKKELEKNLVAISFFGYREGYERLINGNGEEAHKMYKCGNKIIKRIMEREVNDGRSD